jgi:hypothetical protein
MPSEKTAIRVYVTDAEHERLTSQAAQQGLSVSAHAHARLFDDDELSAELRMVLMDFAERLGVLEAWHERAKAEKARREAQRLRAHPTNEIESPVGEPVNADGAGAALFIVRPGDIAPVPPPTRGCSGRGRPAARFIRIRSSSPQTRSGTPPSSPLRALAARAV